jgi:hypothetical protein
MRHLPDFGGSLKASDVEVMVQVCCARAVPANPPAAQLLFHGATFLIWQVLLAPYLRIPLLLNFFADASRTSALSSPELQHMLDAVLFEPGEWQPPVAKTMPKVMPAPNRAHLATPAGLLFQELTHAASAPLAATCAIVDNALDLDAGRYVRSGSSATILYAIRLGIRVEGYARFLLATEASTTTRVRGLSFPGAGAPSLNLP